jgi:polyprenyl P-hydroxybenzoate/phenylacrylic acid decarboxylase-like protein
MLDLASRTRLVVALTGATGVIYGIRLLEALSAVPGMETHLVCSSPAKRTLIEETDYSVSDVERLAHVVHDVKDIGATIASGSFRTAGMVVAPCSIRTAAAIATGVTGNLITRAADVTLKEGRPLLLLVRETPLHLGHLRTLVALAEMGAVVLPPLPAFGSRPKTLDDLVNQTVARVLDRLGVAHALTPGAEADR